MWLLSAKIPVAPIETMATLTTELRIETAASGAWLSAHVVITLRPASMSMQIVFRSKE